MTSKKNKNRHIEILIAEDSRTQAEQLQLLLEEHGYTVTTAPNGMAALTQLRLRQPALVISDIMMPELDGYGLCRALKSDEKLKSIPVMLVTTLSDPQDVIRGLECGADNFIRKPYDEKYLLSRIDYLLMNIELRKDQRMQMALEINLGGHKHSITAERQQILDLLVSTYEQAVQVNSELKQREKELAQANQVLQALNRISGGLNAAVTEHEVAETALRHVLDLPGVQAGWISLRTGEAGLRLVAACGLPPALSAPGAFDADCACWRKLLSGELDAVTNVTECERLMKATGDTRGLRCHASVPLALPDGRVLGLMNLAGPDDGRFSDAELKVLQGAGNQVAAAVERARLHQNLEKQVAERTAKLAAEVSRRMHIQEEQARLAAIIEATPDLVGTASPDGRLMYCNPAGRRLLGYEANQDVSSLSVAAAQPEWAAKLVLEEGIPCAIKHGTWSAETAMRRRDGTEIPVSQVVVAHKDADGAVKFFSIVARDITERQHTLHTLQRARKDLAAANAALERERAHLADRVAARTAELTVANRQLAQAKAEAEAASRAKSAFLATMSHEIRTPMNGVIGMIEVLAHTRLSEHQADLARTIRESATALVSIIDDILDFSKIEAGRLEMERAPVSVVDLVEGLCDSLVPVAARRGVDLNLFIAPDIPQRVLSDDVRLRQILYNLVGNAIKFSAGQPERRGRVSVRAELADRAPLRLAFRITDNGIGMAAQTLQNLFAPFAQAEVSTTRRFGGTGLGLAICKRLVDLMQGEICVTSTLGEGSTFIVTLPFECAPEQPARSLPDLAGLQCIVVHSEELSADDLRVYLEHAGARVHRAADAPAAAQAAAHLAAPVVVIQAAGHEQPAPAALRTPFAGVPATRHLLIVRGRRRRARVEAPDLVTLDADGLRRQAFLRAVAVAAGRASPEIFHEGAEEIRLGAQAAPPSIAQARAQGRLILVAEDDEINQKVIMQQLALLGYAAEVADDGAQALRMWREGRYALLLTDLHMPEMDGYTLSETIRRKERGRRMPILALTANALRGEASHAKSAGMDEYLTKPLRLHLLKAALEKWLPPAEAGQAPAAPSPEHPRREAKMPVLDVTVLHSLVGDEPQTVRTLLADYLASARRLAQELRGALAAGDTRQAGAIAHKLKSSSRSVGALALGDLCAALENAGRAEDKAGIAQAMASFEAALAALQTKIDSFLSGK